MRLGVSTGDGGLATRWDKARIKDAPNAEADGELSQEEEARLYQHYGLAYSENRSDTGLPEGGMGSEYASTSDTSVGNSKRWLDRMVNPGPLSNTPRYCGG